MNTLEIVPTPANARKIKHLSSIMKLHVDDVVMEMAKLDIFDSQAFMKSLPTSYAPIIDRKYESVVEFAADTNWRCMIITSTNEEFFASALLTAKASGVKPIIIVPPTKQEELTVIKMLCDCCIDYQKVDERFDLKEKKEVLVVPPHLVKSDLFKATRSGIFITLAHRKTTEGASSTLIEYESLGMEYQHLIIGVSKTNTTSQTYYWVDQQAKSSNWVSSQEFQRSFCALFPGHTLNAYIDPYSTSANNKNLMNSGFLLSSPERLAPVLHINTSLVR